MKPEVYQALKHATSLVEEWHESGEKPTEERFLKSAREVSELFPTPAKEIADIALTITELTVSLFNYCEAMHIKQSAALGSAAGLSAYQASKKAGK